MYQALYRKWRPKTFADVVGQEHITQTLRNQVAEGRTSHAYLFTGTRGTGKTTCAKILAKAVNCENPQNGDPCNCCPSCLGIDSGSFLDVLELDAASNNGVDQVRALRDEAIYSPAQVKRRVYIVDEVHMLSTAAFNALLKILEEPPEHLMFILATTELHKVPATILSRCQRFSFKRITPLDIQNRLLYVAAQEQLDLKPDGAELLSRLADGALRDALSLLDQCAAAGGTVDSAAVLDVLGLAGNVQTAQLMDCVLRRDAKAALLLLNQLYAGGKDMSAVLNELATLTRDLLLRKTAPEGGAALLSGGFDSRTLDMLDKNATSIRLLYLASTLQAANADLQRSTNRRTDAELCLLRLCDESLSGDLAALCARMDRLESRMERLTLIGTQAAPAAAPAPIAAAIPAEPVRTPAPAAANDAPPWEDAPAAPLMEEPPVPEEEPPFPMEEPPVIQAPVREAPPPVPLQKAPSASGSTAVWKELAERCKGQLRPMYRAFLDRASGTLEDGMLTVVCDTDVTKRQLDNDHVTPVLKETASALAGSPVSVRFTIGKPAESSPEDKMQKLIDFGSKFDSFELK